MRERDWSESKVSQGQGEGQSRELNQPLPPDLEAQGAAIKKTRKLERQWVAKKKNPDSLARTAQDQGQRGTREACVARVKGNFGRAREASTTQTRAKDKT